MTENVLNRFERSPASGTGTPVDNPLNMGGTLRAGGMDFNPTQLAYALHTMDVMKTRIITSEADLALYSMPLDVDNRYPSIPGVEYRFVGEVVLTAGRGILANPASLFTGNTRSSETLRGNRSDHLIKTNGGTTRIRNIRLRNDGGPLINANNVGSLFATVFQSVALGPCTYIGDFGTSLAVIFDTECTATGLTDTGAMIRFTPGTLTQFALMQMSAYGNSANNPVIDLATASFLFIGISLSGFILSSGKSVIEGAANGANILAGGTGQVLNCPVIGGGAISNTILPGDPRWTIINSSPSRDSSTFANWGSTGGTTVTTVSATATPLLSSGMAAGVGNQRFSFTQQTDYIQANYTDSRVRTVEVDASVTLNRSGGTKTTFVLSVFKNGTLLSESEADVEVDATSRTVRSLAVTTASQNDAFQLMIRRTTGSADAIATSIRALIKEV